MFYLSSAIILEKYFLSNLLLSIFIANSMNL